MEKYEEQKCDKHDQLYGSHLEICPICFGELLEKHDIAKQPNIMEAMKNMEDKGV